MVWHVTHSVHSVLLGCMKERGLACYTFCAQCVTGMYEGTCFGMLHNLCTVCYWDECRNMVWHVTHSVHSVLL